MWRPAVLLLAFLGLSLASTVSGAEALALERRLTEVFSENNAKVLRIKAAYESPEEGGQVSLRVGTGFFVSSDGLILANSSVTDGARRIWAERGEATYVAEMVASDAETNIALLRVTEQQGNNFDFLPIDDYPYPPVGTLILSIGCALEFDPSPRLGLVTGQDSNFGQRVFPTAYIRTTIPANPGEGGSPVLDLNGRLMGMIVASLPEVGASYVIPSSAIGKVRDDLLLSGKVQYGWIGVEVENRPRRADDAAPLLVTSVTPGGPADSAGIREGDRILLLSNEKVGSINVMRHKFFLSRVGQYIDFRIERGVETLDLGVRVGERPSVAGTD